VRRLALVFALGVAACNAPESLSETESPIINGIRITPLTASFGTVQVGQSSASQNFRVYYQGFGSDTVSYVDWSCPDFQITWSRQLPYYVYQQCTELCDSCYPNLCAAPTCCASEGDDWDFDAVFSPTVGATVSCPVVVHLQGGGTLTTTLSGTGSLPPIDVDVQPPSVGFGDVRRNTDSSSVMMTVRNAGGSTMNVSSVDIDSGFSIQSGNTGNHDLAPGESEQFQIVCHPTATGGIGGYFNVHTNDPSTPDTQIPLSCNGIDSALDISPSPTTFANTRVGEPLQMDVTLENTGGASMDLEGVAVTGTDLTLVGSAPTGTVGPGGQIGVTVAFGAAAKGTQTGALTITYDGGQTRSSPISARAMATSMSVTPDGDVMFGPVCAGQTKSQTFTVLANEEASFQVDALSSPGGAFSLASPSLPFVVQGSGANKLMFDVTAAPTAAGDQSATLSLTTDIPNATPRQIKLSVTGIAAGVTPSPGEVDFGPNTINTTTIGESVNLSNCSTGAITFTNARIEGTDAGDFAIVAQPMSATINPTNSATWLVVFQGHTVGMKTANFVVDYDGGSAMVPLLGEGVGDSGPTGDPGDDPIDERSYYTCSSGSGSGSSFGMLVFVVGLVMWRRRRAR
jgi:MYXO-CTERM domain-containing protein